MYKEVINVENNYLEKYIDIKKQEFIDYCLLNKKTTPLLTEEDLLKPVKSYAYYQKIIDSNSDNRIKKLNEIREKYRILESYNIVETEDFGYHSILKKHMIELQDYMVLPIDPKIVCAP